MSRRPVVYEAQINDQTWNGLIRIAIRYQNRVGKFHNIRYDRMSIYIVENVQKLAMILIDDGVIQPWPAGFRRLRTIEEGVKANFLRIHGKYHTDP